MRLRDSMQVVYVDILAKSFVVENELLADDSRLSAKLMNVDPAQVETEVKRLLESKGYSVSDGKVVQIGKRSSGV